MSLFLLGNVALDLIRLFLKSTIKAISSRFTLGFHGSNLQPTLISTTLEIAPLPLLIMNSVMVD